MVPHVVSQSNAETFIQDLPQQLCAGKWAETPRGSAIQPQEIRTLAPCHTILVSLIGASELWSEACAVSDTEFEAGAVVCTRSLDM